MEYYRIDKVLSSCSSSTGDIISTTERLQQEFEIITQRQEIVSCFLRDYQLSNEEVIFQSNKAPLNYTYIRFILVYMY
jgi:thiaminase